jgi:hypothetical protein
LLEVVEQLPQISHIVRYEPNVKIRNRLISGFLFLMFAGMAFTGLRLAPSEELPAAWPLVLAAALVGGLVQFAVAVLSITDVAPIKLYRTMLATHGVVLALVAFPFGTAVASIAGGAFSIETAIVIGITLLAVTGLVGTARALKNRTDARKSTLS